MPLFRYNDPRFLLRRRALRRSATLAETRFWTRVRKKQFMGLKFWRQYGIGPYIVDFYCPKIRLAIELDGDLHFLAGAPEYDRERQCYIESFDIRVIRFLNSDIRDNLDGVLQTLEIFISSFYHPVHTLMREIHKRGSR